MKLGKWHISVPLSPSVLHGGGVPSLEKSTGGQPQAGWSWMPGGDASGYWPGRQAPLHSSQIFPHSRACLEKPADQGSAPDLK